MEKTCWSKAENKDKRPQWLKDKDKVGEQANVNVDTGSKVEFVLCGVDREKTFPTSHELLNDPNLWLGDSAATTHTTCHDIGMRNTKPATYKDAITVGNGENVKAAMIGEIPGVICDKHGNAVDHSVLTEVTHLPGGKYNLFSLTRMIKLGWTMTGDKTSVILHKGPKKVVFDIVIPTAKGMLFGMYFKRDGEIAGAMTEAKPRRMTISEAHGKLGHSDEATTRRTAKELGIDIVRGTMQPCEACTVAKAKQKNVPKQSDAAKGTKEDRRIFMDISTIKGKKDGPSVTKPNWRIMVDEHSSMKFTHFYQTKNGMVEPTCEIMSKWKQDGHGAKYVRMDNAGENKLLNKRADSKDWKLNIKFEYTGRSTPQRNHLAELGFASLANKGRALMIAANVPMAIRYVLFKEAFTTATKLDALVAVEVDGVTASRYKHFFGADPDYANYLKTWGEAGTVTLKDTFTPKVNDRGVQCMMIGYAPDHPGDTYRMWDPKTRGVHETRDIIWLKQMFYQKVVIEEEIVVDEPGIQAGKSKDDGSVSSGERDTDDNEDNSDEDDDDDDDEKMPPLTTRSGRNVNPPARLVEEIAAVASNYYEIGLTNSEQRYYDTMHEFGQGEIACLGAGLGGTMSDERFVEILDVSKGYCEVAYVGAGLGGGFQHTSELKVLTYKKAMATENSKEWQEAVNEEHRKMEYYKVFQPVLRTELPEKAKILTSTWAMKKKSNGVYRARINARGYEQIDGEHYDSHAISSPVTNDVTIRIVLVLMLMAGWVGELLDVKGAFLHGDFEDGRNVYMEVPEGFQQWYNPMLYVLLLLQTLYGLKQAAKAFWEQLLKAFASMNYARSKADPCLYFQWTVFGLVLWISWIDDCLCVGPKKGVEAAKKDMMDRFDCDEVGGMDEYVGCKLDCNWEDGSLKITQPVLLQSFVDEFDLPDEDAVPMIPADGGQILQTCTEENALPTNLQKKFRSGTGKLLHMMRWSRPEILNPVRELSKGMKSASFAHLKAMYKTMRYCVATAFRGLFLKPSRKWDGSKDFKFIIKGRSDANYATDPENRRSVSGYSVFLEDAPVAMKCVGQKMVTLSTAEAELAAATQCAQEMLYVMRILESIGLQVQKPMELEIDNKGAVDLANNWSVGGRTRHVEVRQYFLRDLKAENIILPKWIPGDTMTSDLFTKNLERPLFERHAKAYVGDDEYMKAYKQKGNSQVEGSVGVHS
jgi:hypothetical protein